MIAGGMGRSLGKQLLLITGVGWVVILLLLVMISGTRDLFVSGDDSSNGVLMPTTLYLAGSGDDLTLWMPGPDEDAEDSSKSTIVNEQFGQGYIDVGTWESNPLDKDLHGEGTVTVHLFLNSSEDDGPDVRFMITMFGETHETSYYGTNTGITPISTQFDVPGWDGNEGNRISMYVQVDAGDSSIVPSEKSIHLHYWSESFPSAVSFPSDATEIAMEANLKEDSEGMCYFEIFVNITDAFEDRHINGESFIFNITSENDPDEYSAEAKSDGSQNPEFLQLVGIDYWDSLGHTCARYRWYFDSGEYDNGVVGQGVEAGDFLMHFEMNDTDGNQRYFYHLKTGVNPLFVPVNIHTVNEYITIVDKDEKNVEEVAAYDEVRVRLWVEINRGREWYTYEFYVEFRDNGVLVEEEKKLVQMKGYTGKKVFFDWEPTEGEHNLTIDVDSDNHIDETDESDNNASLELAVIQDVKPYVIISSPTPGEYINSDEYVEFDASGTTNPIIGDMTFEWTIFKQDGEEYKLIEILGGNISMSSQLYHDEHGSGDYIVILEVENDERTATDVVHFRINAIPEIVLDSPVNGEIFSPSEEGLFNASGSWDDDGDQLYFRWFSDLGGVLNRVGVTNEMGTLYYTDYSMSVFSGTLGAGRHTIFLEVTDYNPANVSEEGPQGIASRNFVITVNTPPRVEITSPLNNSKHSARSLILFDGSGSYDPDDPDGVNGKLSFRWTDGGIWLSSEPIFQRELSGGVHEIALRISDGITRSEGRVFIKVGYVPVAKTDDVVIVELLKSKVVVPLDASGSHSPDKGLTIKKYFWDLDADVDSDGDSIPDNDMDIISGEPFLELEYREPGNYTVVLVVEDDDETRSEPFTTEIRVLDAREKITRKTPLIFHFLLFAVVVGALREIAGNERKPVSRNEYSDHSVHI